METANNDARTILGLYGIIIVHPNSGVESPIVYHLSLLMITRVVYLQLKLPSICFVSSEDYV